MSKTPTHTNLLTCDEMIDLGMDVPEILERLEDHLGPQAVWKLTETYGGRTISIPQQQNLSRSILADQLGLEIVK